MKPKAIFEIDLKPINLLARLVTGKGIHFTPIRKKTNLPRWNICPDIIEFPGIDEYNMQGRRFGRFEVVGYYGKTKSQRAGRWIVRCACGMYEIRTAKSIKNPRNNNDACEDCRHWMFLKQQEVIRLYDHKR